MKKKNFLYNFKNRMRFLSALVVATLMAFTGLSLAPYIGQPAATVAAVTAFVGFATMPVWFKHIAGYQMGILGTGAIPPTETPEQKEKRELLDTVVARVKEVINGAYTSKDELGHLETKLSNMLKDAGIEGIKEELTNVQAAVKAIKEFGLDPKRKADIREQIKSWQEANATAFKQIKAGQKADLTALDVTVKLNSPMTPSNTYNGSAYLPIPEFQPGATEIVRVQPTFWDFIRKGRTTSAAYVWVNRKNPEGAAGFIGPGVAKPGVSFEIATEISNAKKVAVSEKCAIELLEDIEGMATWIEQELAYQLKQKINTTLMTGVASSTVPAGIQTISVAYTLAGVETTDPNIFDALVAIVTQLRSGNLVGSVTVFLNPVDYANMLITKAQSQGQYMNFTRDLDAVIVVDNNITQGFVQAAILDYYKVLIYKDFSIAYGSLKTWLPVLQKCVFTSISVKTIQVHSSMTKFKTLLMQLPQRLNN
jgi:HK97 family phage major capsid protein